jgi:hypothetical protein
MASDDKLEHDDNDEQFDCLNKKDRKGRNPKDKKTKNQDIHLPLNMR